MDVRVNPEFLQQHLEYTGYVQGEVSVLKEPLPVPDGAQVRMVLPTARRTMPGQTTGSSARETCGLLPADPVLVHAVLQEHLSET
jgi:hypothetical protein